MPGESWNVNYYLLSIGKVLSLQYKVMVWVIFLLPTHVKTLYVLKFNLCVWMNVDAFIDHCPNFIIRWLLSPFQRPLPPFWLHFMLHQCKLPAILHAFLCCLLLSLVRFPWNNLRINFLCQWFTERLLSGETWNEGKQTKTGKEARPRCEFSFFSGDFRNMNYAIEFFFFFFWGKKTILSYLNISHHWLWPLLERA